MIVEWGHEQLDEKVHRLDDIFRVYVVVDSATGHISRPIDNVDMFLQRIKDARLQDDSDYLILDPSTENNQRFEMIYCIGSVFIISCNQRIKRKMLLISRLLENVQRHFLSLLIKILVFDQWSLK